MQLYNAKPYSLILLDEPEVSLHPGAQKRFMKVLYDLVEKKKFQVILSTHSPVLVSFLPKEAVKLFLFENESEGTKISQNISSDEAFTELGHDVSKKNIIVEDRLAKEIVERSIKNNPMLQNSISINYIPGGAETILSKHLPSHALVNREDIIFLLDGDKNKKLKPIKIDSVAQADLVKTMKEHFGCELTVHASGNNGISNGVELNNLKRSVLEYALNKVLYLPFQTPEQLLIDNCCSKEQISLINSTTWIPDDLDKYKKQLLLLTQHHLGKENVNGDEIFFLQKHLISKLDLESQVMIEIRKLITNALEYGIMK